MGLYEYVVASGIMGSIAELAGSLGGCVKSFRVLVGEMSMLDVVMVKDLL